MAEKKKSKKASTTVEGRYGADKLEHLSIREQVRRRPGMWIGNSSSKGLHHLIHEIVDNSVDEFMAGHGDLIEVTITEDQWVTVRDHARGIPVDIHKKSGLSGLELVLTQVGGGGKYGGEDSGYKVSGGLHGAGSSVVNFVSSEMKATVYKDGYEWHQSYKTGIPDGPVKKGKKTKETGTEISWRFDDEIFEKGIKYERETVERRLRELAYLNPGLTITLDFHGHKKAKFYAEGGLSDYMKALVADRDGVEAVHKAPILLSGEVTEEIEKDGMKVEDTTFIDVALYWTTQQNESAHSFVNSINTPEGGTHYDGLRSGLRKALNDAADELGKFRAKDEPFEQVDTREGLFLAVSVKVSDPQFEGQTKGKLNNPEVQKRVHDFVAREAKNWLLAKENKSQADRILDRVIEARDGRLAARKAKRAVTERKGLLGASGLPGKLADCRVHDRDQTEIFIVEGDSAGGGMKQARNRETQAVMPLRGKIQNAEKAGEKTLDSEAIKEILLAIGGVVTDIKVPVKKNGKIVNRTKLVVDASSPRYGKIIICSVDGQEMTFVRDAEGKTRCVRIGPFIDELIARGEDVANYQVLCFDQRSHETRFKPLKAVIAHPIEENLYKITTAYGRSVRVTASHSVFVYRDGQVELKRGDEIEVGDQVVIPRTLPLSPGSLPSSLDLVRELHGTHQAEDLWLRGPAVRSLREKRLAATGAHISKKRVSLSQEARQMMREARQAKKYTLRDLAVACGVSEAASVSEWETGRTRPSRQSFAAYCSEVGLDPDALAAKGAVVEPSQLEALQLAHRNSANAQTVRSAIRLSELTEEELNALGSDVTIGSGKHASFALPRFLPLDKDFFFLLGLFIAEGSTGPGVRFSLGPNDDHFIDEIYAASKRLFGQEPRRYESYSDSRGFELRIHNAVAEVLFKQVFGFEGHRSDSKRLPDLFFDAGPELQLECLRGIFLGDGSYGPNGSVIFNTVSFDLASQLVYALASFGVLASHSIVPAQGKMRFPRHSVAVVARSDLAKIKRVWESRPEAAVRAREPVVDDISTVEVSQWPERMTPAEIADALNCSAWTVRTAMREGRLPFEVPAGKSVRDRTAHRDDVLQWAKDRLHSRRSYTEISSDLVAVDVTDVEVVEPSCNKVYDFSVEEDENFVCGTGGVCCHNTDADVDGGHITTLLLTFFFRYARSLIEEGRVYIAELPLYRIEHKTKGRLYLYSDEELQKYVKKDEIKKRGDGLDITRFKGLGEMMPAQLAETALNPETRRLRQVTLDDESEAEDMTTLLMGNRVERRREYIEENATEIEADI